MWWFLALPAATASEHPAEPDEHVTIDAFCGSVTVVGQGRSKVMVEGTGFEVRSSPGRTWVGGSDAFGLGCLELTVTVPEQARVQVEGVSVSLVARDLQGELHLETVSGGLLVEGRGPRRLEAESVSGSLTVRVGQESDVDLTTVSGYIAVNGGPYEELEIESVSGTVAITAQPTATARLEATTHSGELRVSLGRAPGKLTAATHSGSITNRHSSVAPTPKIPGESLVLSGESGPTIALESFSGAIIIDKEKP